MAAMALETVMLSPSSGACWQKGWEDMGKHEAWSGFGEHLLEKPPMSECLGIQTDRPCD